MRIFWTGVPAEVRAAAEPHLQRFLPLLPKWLERVHVAFNDNGEGNIAGIKTNEEYRSVYLDIYPRFLTLNDDMRVLTFLHEFTHPSQARMDDVFHALLNSLVDEDDPMYAWASEQWRIGQENSTSDIEYGVARLLGIDIPEEWSKR